MGLDTTHGAWHGSYGAFMRWRTKIAAVASMPPLELMDGFFERGNYLDPIKDYADRIAKMCESMGNPRIVDEIYWGLPIRWEALAPSPLHYLLNHSDCEGSIPYQHCGKIADELEKLLPALEGEDVGGHIGNYVDKTKTFIEGLRKAHKARQKLGFH